MFPNKNNQNSNTNNDTLKSNFLKFQLEKNFSTGNINLLEDTNESSADNDNDYSFNDDLNSISSYDVENNSISSSMSNINNLTEQEQSHPEVMYSLENNSSSFHENENQENSNNDNIKISILKEEKEIFKPQNNADLNIKINILSENENNDSSTNNEVDEDDLLTPKDTNLHKKNNTNDNINDNNGNNNINNSIERNKISIDTTSNTLNKEKNDFNYTSLLKKNLLIPKELKGITGSYSSLIYNELTKSINNNNNYINQNESIMSSTEYLDNISGYDSSCFSPTSASSLINSPRSPLSPSGSLNSSKLSLNQIPEKITSPTTQLTQSPIGIDKSRVNDENSQDIINDEIEKDISPTINDINNEKEKRQNKISIKSDVLTDKELDNFHRWVLCFCVVNFDLEIGQALEYVYPPTNLTNEEKKNVSFSAFPDSNSSSHKGNSIFCFRMKSGPSTEKLYHRQHHFSPVMLMKKEDQRFNKQLNNPEKYQKDLKIDMDGYIYGYVFFRQQKDPTNKRGFFQKSFVLLSPHPFKGLFMKIVEKLGLLYFSSLKIGQTVEDEILLKKRRKIFKMAVSFINKWPNPPSILNERYFFIRSNSVKQTPPNILLSFPFFKSIYPITFAPASHYPQFFNTNTNSQNMNSQDKPSKVTIHQEMPVCPGRIYEIFRQSIGDAWQIWEMMILGEPILVLGDTPRSCSETIYAFMELIKPVPYGGDFRPYFTIQDSDFKNVIKKEATLPNIIIGTTNPVFSKALSHWPNIVYVQRRPCNNSMINNDKIAQQPVGVGKPIKRESQSIVSSLWTSLLPSTNKSDMTTSTSLKGIATLFPNIGSTSSINNVGVSSSISNSNTSLSTNNLSSSTNNNYNPSTSNTTTNTTNATSSSTSNNRLSGFSGFNWPSLLNGSSNNGNNSTNPLKYASSHDITSLKSNDNNQAPNNNSNGNSNNNKSSSQSSSLYSSFLSTLSLKKSNEALNGKGSGNDTANSSTSTLQEVTSLTPAVSSSNLLKDEDKKPAMPTSVQPTPPGKTNIECVEKVMTKHKSYFHKDRNVIKKITEAALMGYSLDIINNMFRRHFVELSEKFLQPLDYYFDKEVIYNVRLMKFSDLRFSPQIENFNIEAFLKIINETAPVFPLKCKRTLIEFYRLFIKSPNFSLWFLLRICNALREWRRRYFYVMCEGDIRYWIKTSGTRFYSSSKSTTNTNSGSNGGTSSTSTTNNTATTTATSSSTSTNKLQSSGTSSINSNSTKKLPSKPEDLNVNTSNINTTTNNYGKLKSPDLKPRRTNNTFDTSIGRLKNKEANIRTPRLIEIIELLMRYRDEIYHYEGLFVEKDVDLTSFSSDILSKEKNVQSSSSNANGFYQMRRTFSGSANTTPNTSKTSLDNEGPAKRPHPPTIKEGNNGIESSSTPTLTKIKTKLKSDDTQNSNSSPTVTPTAATPTISKSKGAQGLASPTNNSSTDRNKLFSITNGSKPEDSKSKSISLIEEATLHDLDDQEITKMYDREELIKRIFLHPEIEKFKKRKSRHRHIILPIPLSCPTPKSTRFYENLTSMDDLILPTRDQYQKMKKQYQLLLNIFTEDLRVAIEAELRD